jgi:hypothetical protein
MVEIPSTGNIGIDISIAIISGGVVTTWLTFLVDYLRKRKEEYMDKLRDNLQNIEKSKIFLSIFYL